MKIHIFKSIVASIANVWKCLLPESHLQRTVLHHYLYQDNFKGLPLRNLNTKTSTALSLIEKNRVAALWESVAGFPYVNNFGFPPIDAQVKYINEHSDDPSICLYPTAKSLSKFRSTISDLKKPYTYLLKQGSAQLSYRIFEPDVLERYRNDPKTHYFVSDDSGRIVSKNCLDEDNTVILENFGFGYNDSKSHRFVVVFIVYLSRLSSKHQNHWKTYESSMKATIHPSYRQRMLEGRSPDKLLVTNAICIEIYLLNKLSMSINNTSLFKNDYGKYFENKPIDFAFLVRPTKKELYNFYSILDKMLSENINKKYFLSDLVMHNEQIDNGEVVKIPKGTISLLKEWFEIKYFNNENNPELDVAISIFRDVRGWRQKPAHSIITDEFDQSNYQKQRLVLKDTYYSLRFLRNQLENGYKTSSQHDKSIDQGNEESVWFY